MVDSYEDLQIIKSRGNKATHITALPNGRDIVDVVIGKPGPTSDKKIFDERQSAFAPQQKFQGDKENR